MIPRMNYYIGIDVGTGSARAGLFDQNGTLEAMATREIQMWKPEVDYYEQSSDDIWKCICECAKQVMQESGVAPAAVKGLGFDATCSLVALDGDGQPVTVSPDGVDAQNVIVWMDHRALKETDGVNAFNTHEVFEYVGGKISRVENLGDHRLIDIKLKDSTVFIKTQRTDLLQGESISFQPDFKRAHWFERYTGKRIP